MSTTTKIKRAYLLLGFDLNKRSPDVFPALVNTLGAALCASAVSSVFSDSNQDLFYRFLALRDVNMILSALALSADCMFFKVNMINLFNIIDNAYSKYGDELSLEKESLIVNSNIKQVNLLKIVLVLMLGTVFILVTFPGFGAVYMIMNNGMANTNITDLPHSIAFQYPTGYDVIETYIVVYILGSFFIFHIFALAICVFGTIICTLHSIVTNIELFLMNLKDIDTVVASRNDKQLYAYKLRDYLNYLIRCHQQIQRQVKTLTSSVSLVVSISNQCLCFRICVSILGLAEANNTFLRIAFFGQASTFALMLLVYCTGGQKIIDASEKIRHELYECQWLNKPEWFKKDLQFVMTMSNMPLHVKPHGLYVLNFNAFTSMMNAAYTYYNVLRTLKQ